MKTKKRKKFKFKMLIPHHLKKVDLKSKMNFKIIRTNSVDSQTYQDQEVLTMRNRKEKNLKKSIDS